MHLSLILPGQQTITSLEFTARFEAPSDDKANGGAIRVRDPLSHKETMYRLVVGADCSLRLKKIR